MDLDDLRARLTEACRQFQSDGEQSDGVGNDKAGAVAYLDALADFLDDAGIERPLLRPLREMIGAFVDANKGVNPPLFRKRSRKGAPPLSADRAMLMAMAAVAITRLMDANFPKDEASAYAAKSLTSAGVKISSGRKETPAWESLKFMREKVMAGRLGEIPQSFYQRFAADTRAGDPKKQADAILANIPELHRMKSEKA